jgi:hypothetical protein
MCCLCTDVANFDSSTCQDEDNLMVDLSDHIIVLGMP